MLSPEFFTDAKLVKLPPLQRLLFAGLWCYADRVGLLRDDAEDLAVRILPRDRFDAEKALDALADAGLVVRYEHDDHRMIWVRQFTRHQRPHKNEAGSDLHFPCDDCRILRGSLKGCADSGNFSATRPMSAGVGVGVGVGVGEKQQPCGLPSTVVALAPVVDLERGAVREVFDHWRQAMATPKSKLDAKRTNKIRARLKEGYSVAELKQAVDGCALTPFNTGKNDRGQKYDGIELICRDAEHVDRFIANATSPPKPFVDITKGRVGVEHSYPPQPGKMQDQGFEF